jgi:hypothetical protein
MPRIDKNSITATQTADPKIFVIEFDFTDDLTTDVSLGFTLPWYHARFTYNTAMTIAQFNTAANAAMILARKPDAETTLEATLRSKFGVAFVRTDPTPPAVEPMIVRVVT